MKKKLKNDVMPMKVLRFAVFAALVVASAAAALMPDWAKTLKAQSYSGYVDLQLSAVPSMKVLHAGTSVDVLASILNAGPEDAHNVRTLTTLDGLAAATATSGCAEDPLGYPGCTLSAQLNASASADYLVTIAVSPLARGFVTIGIGATSDDVEAAPGNESLQFQLPVEAHEDLAASASCNRAYVTRENSLSCQITLSNAGPAAATPYFNINTGGATISNFGCAASRAVLCPAQIPLAWKSNLLMPGEQITLSFAVSIDATFPAEAFSIYASATAGYDEIEDHASDNSSAFAVTVSLFRDGFGD
jgi:hypothetical protein